MTAKLGRSSIIKNYGTRNYIHHFSNGLDSDSPLSTLFILVLKVIINKQRKHLRKQIFQISGFPTCGGGNPITNASSGFSDAKNDLIAELKMSHNVGGISKLRTEQQKIQEQHEQEQYKRFLAQFTMENFLEKVT